MSLKLGDEVHPPTPRISPCNLGFPARWLPPRRKRCIPQPHESVPATRVKLEEEASHRCEPLTEGLACCIPQPHESVPATIKLTRCKFETWRRVASPNPTNRSLQQPPSSGRGFSVGRVASPNPTNRSLQRFKWPSWPLDFLVASPNPTNRSLQPTICSTFSDTSGWVRTRLAGCYGLLRSFFASPRGYEARRGFAKGPRRVGGCGVWRPLRR